MFLTDAQLRIPQPDKRPALRLVRSADPAPRTDAVARENRNSAALPPEDARAIFAAEVLEHVEGGRAAILRPEHRQRLVARAVTLGLRPFDAHLVIAVVQDATRRGESALGPGARATLAAVRPPDADRRATLHTWLRLLVAAGLAAGMILGWISLLN